MRRRPAPPLTGKKKAAGATPPPAHRRKPPNISQPLGVCVNLDGLRGLPMLPEGSACKTSLRLAVPLPSNTSGGVRGALADPAPLQPLPPATPASARGRNDDAGPILPVHPVPVPLCDVQPQVAQLGAALRQAAPNPDPSRDEPIGHPDFMCQKNSPEVNGKLAGRDTFAPHHIRGVGPHPRLPAPDHTRVPSVRAPSDLEVVPHRRCCHGFDSKKRTKRQRGRR